VVVVAGPDGTGKSTLADSLEGELGLRGPVRRFHHRLAVLPRSAAASRASATPHAQEPYPVPLSWLKVIFLFADHVVGWLVVVLPLVRRGGWVILERGWWDIAVDPRRYRLRGVRGFAARLGRLLPAPDATLILQAPPAVVRARKAELTVAELRRQSDAWLRLSSDIPGAAIVDAARSPEEVLADAVRACGELTGTEMLARSTRRRWAALPPGRRPRWLIPSDSPALARAGLSVHQPMTRGGRIGWEIARLLASSHLIGALRPVEDPALVRLVWHFVPEGGTFAAAYGREANRAVALILDAGGKATGVAKIARDGSGRERLAREAERIRVLGPRLAAPISAPRLMAVEEQIIVFEPVAWRPQSQPWRLPVPLAAGIGRFHRGIVELDGRIGHPGHGDFAPWNVLRTATGWVLLDWEEAATGSQPFADPFHFLVSAHTLLGRPREEELLRGLGGRGWVGEVLGAYMVAASITSDIRDAFTVYLKESAAALRPLHPHSARGRESRLRLLHALGPPD
jgi:thymidylate kinase